MKHLLLFTTSLILFIFSSCTKGENITVRDIMNGVAESDSNLKKLIDARNDNPVIRDSSGMYYKILIQGDSVNYCAPTSIPVVSYSYQLPAGQIVVSSFAPTDFNKTPLNKHIIGWQIGLRKISKGGRIRMYLPPDLAFGDAGIPNLGIPPNSIIICEVSLVDIIK
ncbi:FKBP-type peptidyl-prolyl isomerase-like protein [Chitinophaga dinghuensis]|uniref:Peptidyl-prolyl cis-trans isomerase n=1 Tax=Chitinophaga dinghuensis TaxID=1539050 RepID=A0A327WFL8_9BACT|nr:FKBP-type peptidyl-prolyl cis-trans isomerase [Chitinophaga dinghuensis]RAJ88166.1 FKBP-type peptidyl-prolyl isomerase-like protein [Chitinophaga dinghuensis]